MTCVEPRTSYAAHLALSLVGAPQAEHPRVLREVEIRLDKAAAIARRDTALCDAHRLIGNAAGSVPLLAKALHQYHTGGFKSEVQRRYDVSVAAS